ncbi:MAG: substrate-binding domain-containing protein [Burkholderiales bacterium]|nr:substrate-binding domain-containing protein [Burkholderiales bacterium]
MANLKLFTSNGQRTVMAALLPQFEKATGHRVEASYDPGQVMMRRIASGERADLLILGAEALDELAGQGTIVPESRRVFSRCGIGVAVSAGSPRPDIGSVEAFRRALLAAPSIAYTIEGASGIHFASVIETMGIAREVQAKAVRQPGGLVGELLVAGKAQFAIQQIPELLAVPGITYVGPLPGELQKTTVSAAGIFAGSAHPDAARALIEYLFTPGAASVVKRMGHEPG